MDTKKQISNRDRLTSKEKRDSRDCIKCKGKIEGKGWLLFEWKPEITVSRHGAAGELCDVCYQIVTRIN